MGYLADVVADNDGFATKRLLVALGATDRMLTWAVRSGELIRVRNGWYTTRDPRSPAVRAVRVGGRLTGISALEELGAWRWRSSKVLHVAVRRTDARLRSQHDRRRPRIPGRDRALRVHWEERSRTVSDAVWRVPLLEALVRVILDEPFEDAVIALDWALRTGRLQRHELQDVVAQLPRELRGIAAWVDAASDSILESAVRVRIRRAGFEVRSQVRLPGVSPVDLVVDGVVSLETDGLDTHLRNFDRDRRKDAVATIAGLHPLRPTYSMVRDDWPLVLGAVEAAIAGRLGRSYLATRARTRPVRVGNSGGGRHRRRRRSRPAAARVPDS